MTNDNLIRLSISFGVLLISVILHEISHGASAFALGDPTAKADGRLSLNPLRHIDPFNTIILPILCYVTLGFAFGGAKPVRVNPLHFKKYGLGWALTAIAGPFCNILLAMFSFVILFSIYLLSPNIVPPRSYNALFFGLMIFTNIILAVFNLIPIPPLDGSRVLRYFLPLHLKGRLDAIEPFGLFILIFLIKICRIDGIVIWPFLDLMGSFMFKVFDSSYAAEFLKNTGFYV